MRTIRLFAQPTSGVPLAFTIEKGGLLRHIHQSSGGYNNAPGLGFLFTSYVKFTGTDDSLVTQVNGTLSQIIVAATTAGTAVNAVGGANGWFDFADMIVQDGQRIYIEHVNHKGVISEWFTWATLYFEEFPGPVEVSANPEIV